VRPSLLFLTAHAALVLLGGAAAFHPAVVRLGAAARLSAAFGAGAIVLTIESLLFSLAGVPWSAAGLAAAPVLLGAWAWRVRADPVPPTAPGAGPPEPIVRALAAAALALGLLHLGISFATSRATSIDYLFFWGVKAVHFAQARGIDVALLAWPFFAAHGVPEYPPLVPVVQAWGVLFAGEMPWRRAGPLASALWLVAAIPLVRGMLRRRLAAGPADAVTAFWGTALAISLAGSFSGGNAEVPLVFFETVAGIALITEARASTASDRWLAAAALAGAVLTKVEGLAAAGLLVLGTLARDRWEGRSAVLRGAAPLVAAPVLAISLWFLFQRLAGLPVGYRGHGPLLGLHWEHAGSIALAMVRNLGAGTAGMSWAVPAILLLFFWRRIRNVLPAVALAAGLLAFFAFDYLHDGDDPWQRIGWTLPRVSQPALSLLILAAGVAVFGPGTGERVKALPLKA